MKYYKAPCDMYVSDFLVFAAAKRTLSVGEAFLTMIAEKNFGVAAALLRMQLDTAIHFSALALVESTEDLATKVLGNEKIRDMRARSGERLTDKFLVETLTAKLPWVAPVYRDTSGFIHLSGRHMAQTFHAPDDETRTVKFIVSAKDVPRPADDYQEILEAFTATTHLVISLLLTWLESHPRNATTKE